MIRRFCAFLLSLILVFNMMPITVLAENSYDGYVSISTQKNQLKSGETTDIVFTVNAKETVFVGAVNFTVVMPEGLEYVSHEIMVQITDFSMSHYSSSSGKFGCSVTTNGKNGTFDVLKITVKAKDDAVGVNDVSVTMGNMFDKLMTPLTFDSVEPLAIKVVKDASVDMSGDFVLPKAGETCYETACGINAGEGVIVNYSIDDFTFGGIINAGNYTLNVSFEAEDGYVLTEENMAKIRVYMTGIGFTADETGLKFTKEVTVEKNGIDSVEIINDIPAAPVLGSLVETDVNIIVENATVTYVIDTEDTVFAGDKTYTETITITPNENYKFTNTNVTGADGFVFVLSDGKLIGTRITRLDKNVISDIEVINYSDPEAGNMIVEPSVTSEIYIFEPAFYIGEEKITGEHTVLGNTTYKIVLEFGLNDSDIYKFAENVTLNGAAGFAIESYEAGKVIFEKTVTTGNATLNEIEVTEQPSKKAYVYGEAFDKTGMVVTAYYNDGTSRVLGADEYTIKPEKLVPEMTEVTIEFNGASDTVIGIRVAKKELEITGLEATDRYYNGSLTVFITGGELNGVVDGDNVSVQSMPSEGSVKNANADTELKEVTIVGTTILIGEDAEYYTLKEISGITVKISPKPINDCDITEIDDVTYNKQKHEPNVVFVDNEIIKDRDYTVEYGANVNAGKGTVTVTGIGNYSGSKTVEFKINPATITITEVSVNEKRYDGTKDADVIANGFTGKFNGDEVAVHFTGIGAYFENEYVGTNIKVTIGEGAFELINDEGNYVLDKSYTNMDVTGEIKRAGQMLTVKDIDKTAAKNTTTSLNKWVESNAGAFADIQFVIVGEVNGVIINDGHELVVSSDAEAGTEVTIAASSAAIDIGGSEEPEYDAANQIEFVLTITNKKDAGLNVADVENNVVTKTFGDANFDIEASVSDEAAAENGTWSWNVSGDAVAVANGADSAKATIRVEKAGSATITVVYESATYRSEKEIAVTVNPKIIVANDFNLNEIAASYEYTGSEIRPEIRSDVLGAEDYTVTYASNVNVGEATITIEGKGNYTGSLTKTFGITAKAITAGMVNFVIPSEGYTYGADEKKPAVTVDGLTEGTDYIITYNNNINATTDSSKATVTVDGKGNYSGSITEEFDIAKKDITVIAAAENREYNGTTSVNVKATGIDGVLTADESGISLVKDTVIGNVSDKYAGQGKDVTLAEQFELKEAGAYANYNLIQPTSIEVDISTKEQVLNVYTAGTQSIAMNTSKDLNLVAYSNAEEAELVFTKADDLPDGVTLSDGVLAVEAGKAEGAEFSIKVNSAEIDLNGDEKPEYSAAGEITIDFIVVAKEDAEVNIPETEINKTYGDQNFNITANVANKDSASEGKFTWISSDSNVIAIENANTENPTFIVKGKGDATITVNYEDGKYIGSDSVTVKVESKSIVGATVTGIDATKEYTGEAITFAGIKVMDGTKELVLGTDYSVSYSGNINVGTATVTINGINNYKDSIEKTFEITAKNGSGLTVNGINDSYEYNDGNPVVPSDISVADGQKVLTKGTDYDVVITDNVNPGTAKVTINFKGNYSGKIEKTFAITAKNISSDITVTLKNYSYKYTGKNILPGVVVKYGDTELSAGTTYSRADKDYTLVYDNNLNVGEASVTVKAAGERYTWTDVVVYFEITEVDYNITVTSGQTVKIGKGIGAISLPSAGNGVNGETVEGVLKIYADSEYSDELTEEESKELAIGKYTLYWQFVKDASETNYVGTDKSGSFVLEVIEKDTQTITTSKDQYDFVYGGAAQNIGAEVTVGDGALSYSSDDESVATVDANGNITVHKAGEATITITAADTTEFAQQTKDVKVVVARKQITKPTANSSTFVYNGREQTYSILTNDAYDISGNVAKDADTYTVTVKLKDTDNTEWKDGTTDDLTFEFVINKAQVQKPNIEDIKVTYNGQEQEPVKGNDLYDVTYDGDTTNANEQGISVTATLKDTKNYMWAGATAGSSESEPIPGKLTIKKATITITAKSFTVDEGSAIPSLAGAYTVSGLGAGDKLEDVVGKIDIGYERIPNMNSEGTVAIIVSGPNVQSGYQNNYEEVVVYVNGKLTIKNNDFIIIEVDMTKPYEGKADDETNPNTGAPVFGMAGYAVVMAAVSCGAIILGKRK